MADQIISNALRPFYRQNFARANFEMQASTTNKSLGGPTAIHRPPPSPNARLSRQQSAADRSR